MARKPNHVLTDLIDHMKRTSVANNDYPSKEVQDAYLQFKAYLRNEMLYKQLSVDDEPSNFKKIRKLILELDGAGVNKTWLDADLKDLFNDLVKAIKKPSNKAEPATSHQGLIPLFRGVDKKGFSKVIVTPGGVYGKGVYFYTDPWDARSHATYPGGGVVTGFANRKDVEIHEGGVAVMRDASKFIQAGKLTLDETTLPKSQYLTRIEIALKKKNKAEPAGPRKWDRLVTAMALWNTLFDDPTDISPPSAESVLRYYIGHGKPFSEKEIDDFATKTHETTFKKWVADQNWVNLKADPLPETWDGWKVTDLLKLYIKASLYNHATIDAEIKRRASGKQKMKDDLDKKFALDPKRNSPHDKARIILKELGRIKNPAKREFYKDEFLKYMPLKSFGVKTKHDLFETESGASRLHASGFSFWVHKHRSNRAEATSVGGEAGEFEGDIKGVLGIITGVSDGEFTGGFIPPEIQFIRTVIYLKNQEIEGRSLNFDDASERLINGNDVHLFCGHSTFATTRVDIRKEYEFQPKRAQGVEEYPPKVTRRTAATKNVLVQDFIADAIKRGKKYDLVIIDPPYNADYDKDYGTHQYNDIKETNEFFAWLVDGCTKILNENGILISKNWRNMRPVNSKFVAGILGKFGGFRRVSIMEAWQHAPTSMLDFSWEAFDSASGKQTQMIPWYVGRNGKWTKKELKMMAKHVDLDNTKSGVIITDPLGPGDAKPIKIGNLVNMTVSDFLADEKKHDVIILDQCKGIGGDRPTTVILKDRLASGVDNAAKRAWQHKIYNHAVDVLKRKGFVFTKTYFDPVLQKKDLELLEQHVICYESFEKINMFVLYKKP